MCKTLPNNHCCLTRQILFLAHKNVTTENRNIAACYIGENAELTLDRDPIAVVTNECKTGLDDLTVDVSADACKLKDLGGSWRRKQRE